MRATANLLRVGRVAGRVTIVLMAAVVGGQTGQVRAWGRQPNAPGQAASAGKIAEGKQLYYARCGYCHLAGGTGTIMLERRLGKQRALLGERTDLTSAYIQKITRTGLNSMPPHNRIELPDSELNLIAVYLTRPASARTQDSAQTNGGAHD